jgi:hypothetical protein
MPTACGGTSSPTWSLLGRQLVDRCRRDGAVLVAGFSVLLLLHDMHHLDLVHGLASGDDDRVRWHVVAHGCYIGTPSGTPTARPAHICPCLALSPLGFSCVSQV